MAKDENVTTKFKVDISDLKRNINEANNQIKLANAQFKNATVGMDDWSRSADGLSAKIKAQQAIIDAEKSKLAALKEQLARVNKAQEDSEKEIEQLNTAYKEAVEQFGKNSREAQNYAKQLEAAEKAQQKNADAADKLTIQIVNQDTAVQEAEHALAGYESALNGLDSSTENAEDATEELNDSVEDNSTAFNDASEGGISAFSVALGNLASKVIEKAIEKIVELGKKVKDAYLEFDDGGDAVIRATGATGEAAEALTKSYANVAKSITGDFADIGSALGEVNTRFGYSGEALEETTRKFLKFADITGSDAVGAVQKVSRAMQNAGIPLENYEELLDQLAVVGQATGISVDKVADSLTANGATMRELGFDTAETIAMLGQFELAGVNSETAIAGLKTAVKQWAKEGKNANDEFHNTVDAIMSAPSDIEATQKAIEAFGSKAGTELADAMRTGRFAYDELLATIAEGQGTVENTYENTHDGFDRVALTLQNLKATAGEMVGELVSKYEPQLIAAIDKVNSMVEQAVPVIEKGIEWLENNLPEVEAGIIGIGVAFATWKVAGVIHAITTAIAGMSAAEVVAAAKTWLLNTALLSNPIGLVVAAIAGLVTAFVVLWKKSEKFRNFWIGLWEKIKTTCEPVVSALTEWFTKAWDTIKTVWAVASAWFKQTFDKIKNSAAMDAIINYFKTAWEVIKKEWDMVAGYFKTIFENIKLVFSAVKAVLSGDFEGAWKAIKKIVDNWAKYFKKNVWENIKGIFAVVDKFFGGVFSKAWKKVKDSWSDAGKWFKSKVTDPIKTFFATCFNAIGTVAKTCVNAVKKVWGVVADWYKKTVIDPLINLFTPLFKIIAELAEGCWKLIKAVWKEVSDWFNSSVIKPVKDAFDKAWKAISDFATGAWTTIKKVWTTVSKWFDDTVIKPVSKLFNDVWNAITGFAKSAWDTIKKYWEGAKKWFDDTVVKPVSTLFNTVWKDISGFADSAWTEIKKTWETVSTWFDTNVSQPVKGFFSDMWNNVKQGASDAWTGIKNAFGSVATWFKDTFSEAWQKVKDVFSTGGEVFGGIVDGITAAFKKVVNAIIKGINNVVAVPFNAINNTLDKLRNAEIAGIKPFENLITRFNVPQIPELARGGILRKGQVGLLEGNGAEAVVPLEKNTTGLKKIANLISREIGFTGATVSNVNNYYFTQTNNSPQALSRWDIYRQTKNLLNTVKGV